MNKTLNYCQYGDAIRVITLCPLQRGLRMFFLRAINFFLTTEMGKLLGSWPYISWEKTTAMKHLLFSVGTVVLLTLFATTGQAAISTFTGLDAGAAPTDPHPNSDAAAASFTAASSSLGTPHLIDFESAPLGLFSSLAVAPGVTVSLSNVLQDANFAGIIKTGSSPVVGYSTTPNGSNLLGFTPALGNSSTAKFDFTNPIDAFGFTLTGLQTVFTSSFTVNFNDGTSRTLPVTVPTNGGEQFFGFTDPGAEIQSVSLIDNAQPGSADYFGVDDVRYVTAGPVVSPVPEASTGLLIVSTFGLAGIALYIRRERQAA